MDNQVRVSNDLSKALSGGRLIWSGSPTLDGSPQRVQSRCKASLNQKEDSAFEDGFGDDFDDFEEGAQPGEDDDFGNFDDGIEGLSAGEEVSEPLPPAQDEPEPAFVSRRCSISSLIHSYFQGPFVCYFAYSVIAHSRFWLPVVPSRYYCGHPGSPRCHVS